jgi:hypothetical protein
VKEFRGRKYMGMPVGGRHVWNYPDGTWKEEKVSPDAWVFSFESLKKRTRAAPERSGAPLSTEYHWYILADQRVRKVDKDSYETLMEGVKHKLSHKRPYWRKWSSQYEDNPSDGQRVITILEDMLKKLRKYGAVEYRDAAECYLGTM